MLNRTAWIAFFGCGLLCYAIAAVNLTNQRRDSDPRGGASAKIDSLDQAALLSNCVDRSKIQNSNTLGTDLPSIDSQVPFVADLRSVSNQSVDESAQPSSAFQPANRIQLVSYTESHPDGDRPEPSTVRYWPTAEALVEQLRLLQSVPEIRGWSEQTIALLDAMSQIEPNSSELDSCLNHLRHQLQAVPQLAASIGNRGGSSVEASYARCEVSRMAYRLQRRIAIWETLRTVSGKPKLQGNGVFHSFGSGSTASSVAFSRINFEGLGPTWIEYLKLNELQSAFGGLNPDATDQKKVARNVLARIYSPVLKPDQAAYIQQIIDPALISSLKEHASGPVEQADLLDQIEKYESRASSLTGHYLNDQYQNLLWSLDPADQAVAAEIQKHYRNANFRLVVSEQLLNRLIPELPTTESPISQNVKGARVSGRSQVSNQLQVQLIPNSNQVQLQLATTGNVRSDTIAKTKSFRIQNFGKAQFQVVQQVTISPDGIEASTKPQALSKANQYVVGLESKMDDVPIVGWMARKLAAKKLREEGPDNDRLFQRTVENSAEAQMQEQVTQQLAKIRYSSYTKLFQPLFDLDLEPEPIQMATTDTQVVMRYRLAGRDQMAANTSRPRDSGKSLLSLQLHQSAINNAIARLGLNGNKFTIDELSKHLREVVGAAQLDSNQQESDKYAEIGFAYFDPIHIEFEDDQLKITLNLRSLKVGETGKTWRNVSLTACYRFAVDGMTIGLQQDDDGTRIKGKRLRFGDKAAISAVMKVLFKQQYSMNSMPEKFSERIRDQRLAVSQLVASDGWLAVSIDDQQPTTSQNSPGPVPRTGAIRKRLQRR